MRYLQLPILAVGTANHGMALTVLLMSAHAETLSSHHDYRMHLVIVNVLGYASPGLTSSLALSKLVESKIIKDFN